LFQSVPHSNSAQEMLRSFFVGNYCDPESDSNPVFGSNGSNENAFRDATNVSSPFVDLERNTALFLGLCLINENQLFFNFIFIFDV
jgi:hypothetical protein